MRECPLTAFLPPSIMLPLFENDNFSRKSSSNKLSVGIGVVMGENSSWVTDPVSVVGVFGRLPPLKLGFLHLLMLLDSTLSLLLMLDVLIRFDLGGVLFEIVLATGMAELKLTATPSTLDAPSSTVFTDPSRAFEDVVGASPESLFDMSFSSKPLICLRKAGCVSVGGARGGAFTKA